MLRSITLSLVLASSVGFIVACGSPPDTKMVANKHDDGVAANSASEERLNAEAKPKATPAKTEDPTQPLTTPMNGETAGGTPGSSGAPSPNTTAAAGTGKGGGKGATKGATLPTAKEPKSAGGKVSKGECKQIFDKYIDLTLASDSRFDGIPPEMITQLKAQALSQAQSEKGDPCSTQEVSRTQYNCAITAPTTSAWQRCMK